MRNTKTNYMIVTQDLAVVEGQRNGKLGHSCARVTKSSLYDSRVRNLVTVYLGVNISSSIRKARQNTFLV